MEEVIVIGAANAGYTAALYLARANLNPLLITGHEEGGQLMLTTVIENFPGFPEGIDGPKLMADMKEQCKRFGTRFKTTKATGITVRNDGTFEVEVPGEKLATKAVIIATGASARWLGIDSEKQFQGKGVHTCATCDGFFYKDKEIIVVGGGDSACEEGSFLTKFAKKVYVVHRRDTLRASKVMQKRLLENDKVEMMWDSAITEFKGEEGGLKSVIIKNVKTGEERDMPIDGVFLAIGHIPNTDFCKGVVELDDHGFVKTDRWMHTNVPGIFAAGDVQDTRYKQAITAAGSGCQAALEAEKYVEELGEKEEK